MRSISVIQKDAKEISELSERHVLMLYDQPIHYAIVKSQYPVFDMKRNANYVLVQKKAISFNYRDRSFALMVQQKLDSMPASKTGFYAIGSEFAGIVVEVGAEVTAFQPGDRVISNCQYPTRPAKDIHSGVATNQSSREYEVLHETKLVKMPDNMSFEQGASFTIGAQTAYSMVDRLDIKSGSKVLVTAGNSNTSLFILHKLFQRTDLKIYSTVRQVESRNQLEKLDYPLVNIFIIPDDLKDFSQNNEVADDIKATGMFDYVLDPFMDTNLSRLMQIMNYNAKYISCGLSQQSDSSAYKSWHISVFAMLILKNISVIGNCLGDKKHLYDALLDFEKGRYQVLIRDVIDEGDVKKFFEGSFLNKNELGKVVFSYL